MADLTTLLFSRRSIRTYTDEQISEQQLSSILEAGLLAPTSRNRQSSEFIVIRDRAVLDSLARCRPSGAGMLKGAACAIAVLGNSEKSDVFIEDCCLAMGFMQLAATNLGLGSCWIQCRLRESPEGTSTDDYIRNILHHPPYLHIEAILSLGVPAAAPAPHTREELDFSRIHGLG